MSPHAARKGRVRRSIAIGLPLAVVAALTVAGTATGRPGGGQGGARVTTAATLGDIPLGTFSNTLLPGTVKDDRGVDLGGIGSDLYPAGRKGEFWAVTDRGPNGQIKVDGKKRRTFPVPGFDPAIVKIRVRGDRTKVVSALPLTTSSGKPVTGLPNQEGRDEAPYSYDAKNPVSYDPNGLDTEGLVRAPDGTFWLVDEYGPSLVHVSARGKVIKRYVPRGLKLRGADYPVSETLPGVLLHRETNRGFEGLAQLPGGDLVMAVQSPLSLPDEDAGEGSRTARLLRFSPRKQAVTAEYAYRFDPVGLVDPGENDTSELKISSVVATGRDKLLVQERTDKAARLHAVTLGRGANILGGKWDRSTTRPALEQLDEPASFGVPVLEKRLVVDLNTVDGVPGKIEGIARVDSRTLALINDNDFGMSDGPEAFDKDGRLVDSGTETTVTYVRLPRRY
ncbi:MULTISPECIES: esterase-like activity of phytase family protein [Streptomyces]|uniref:Tat pathway signal protein n=1 Tax=Streptomyces venezuelae TaxID=54571 RepID=A0A5P2B4R8_STRVZ|nr:MULTISPECIES: esterase-like activity of phytase family protein [Streptomyces]NEA01054.1 esterase-like activity of phytase family protein [Streptomyces sp. SID10116]MYY86802.1 esterase-like activity of phytase family protein [Streptomyces sp. SID335]MYZ16842.1 esterase-like activity of phytase family protein [Streptomyces sp. SID337]NDZ90817.1 esterase-like activity of phytase family protein [Streptomyces sp. SID10115]NEB46016.1 esterase-like activity of phytase family protein [Streptomyces 